MNRLRRDVVLMLLRQGDFRLALTVLLMPAGFSLEDKRTDRRFHS